MKRIQFAALAGCLAVLPAAAQRPNLGQLKAEALTEVDKRRKLTQEIVDSVFSFAELGFQEYQTSRYLSGILEKSGFEVQRGVAGIPTAWVARWGSGKPVLALITDIDGIPKASQKPGVAYHDPLIADAPGHGEGHNTGTAVNVTAALVLKDLMTKYGIAGTLKVIPGVAEELVGTKGLLCPGWIIQGCGCGAGMPRRLRVCHSLWAGREE